MKNPLHKNILKDFMNHLERREQTNGWVIVSRPSYETANIRKSSPKERPSGDMKQTFKVYAEWSEMGEKSLDWEIDTFLKEWGED